MPVVSKKQGTNVEEQYYLFDIHYVKPEEQYSKSKFYIVPHDQDLLVDTHKLVDLIRIKMGKRLLGVPGATETEARDNFDEYLKWYIDSRKTVVKIIMIEKERHTYFGDSYKNSDQTDIKIEFRFRVANKTTIGNEVHYHLDKYHKGSSGQRMYPDQYTVIDFTQKRLLACEQIVETMTKVKDKIIDLFSEEQKAIDALDNKTKLLSYET